MAQVSLPYTLQAGQPENVANLMSNLTALRDGINTVDTAQLASGAVTTAKLAAASVTSAKLAPAPYAELTQSATSVANTTFQVPDFTSATYDNGAATCSQALADLANDRLYLRRTGLWVISLFAGWAPNATGSRLAEIKLDNSTILATTVSPNFGGTYDTNQTVNALAYVAANTSYVNGNLYQNSGGGLNCTATLKAVWVGSYS